MLCLNIYIVNFIIYLNNMDIYTCKFGTILIYVEIIDT
jgi:hypothetical protein